MVREIVFNEQGSGTTFTRGPATTHKVFLGDTTWEDLNDVQKKALCSILWGPEPSEYILVTGCPKREIYRFKVGP